MKHVIIHSDGGCQGNPGPGAWAAVLRYGPHVKEISGAVPATTNNRMELQAAIQALRSLKQACRIDFHTDSQYLRKGISEWITGWKAKGWKTSTKQPVKNADLWQALDAASAPHQITWKWVKGHAGDADNERCDTLAAEAISKLRATTSRGELQTALKAFKAAG